MNNKTAEKLGFTINVRGKVWHYETQTEFTLPNHRKATSKDLIEQFGRIMFEAGTSWGKSLKTSEIKKILDI